MSLNFSDLQRRTYLNLFLYFKHHKKTQRLLALNFIRTWSKTTVREDAEVTKQYRTCCQVCFQSPQYRRYHGTGASGSLHRQMRNCVLPPYSSSGNLSLFLGVWTITPSLPFILPSYHWSLKHSLPQIVTIHSFFSRRLCLSKPFTLSTWKVFLSTWAH